MSFTCRYCKRRVTGRRTGKAARHRFCGKPCWRAYDSRQALHPVPEGMWAEHGTTRRMTKKEIRQAMKQINFGRNYGMCKTSIPGASVVGLDYGA